MPGRLVISLDFELIWGIFDHCQLRDKIQYFKNTIESIPRILDLFAEHQIQATWATVGMLFCHDWDDWRASWPTQRPRYVNRNLDSYEFGLSQLETKWSQYFFAPNLVRLISRTPGQELGSHTFSHYYCQESGSCFDSFLADLLAAEKVAKRIGVRLNSLVFPRNQFRENYLQACRQVGMSVVRTNPAVWYWKRPKGNFCDRLFRTGDAYLPWKRKSFANSDITTQAGVSLLPASRFLRPISGNRLVDSIRLQRIFSELKTAAKNNETYHLWWHPHNFGNYPQESLHDLRRIVSRVVRLRETADFVSATMNDTKMTL